MAQIRRYTAQKGLTPQSQPIPQFTDVMGRAVQGIGSSLQDVASVMASRQEKKDEFKAQNAWNTFKLKTQQSLEDSSLNMNETGEGFHDQWYNETYKPMRDEFLTGLPPKMRAKFEEMTADESGAYSVGMSISAATKERDKFYDYSERAIGEGNQGRAMLIDQNADNYEVALQDGYAEIEASTLPRGKKDELRKSWASLATEAYFGNLKRTNPEKGMRELQADPRLLSRETQLGILEKALVHQESRGRPDAVSPKGAIGLFQVMPATASDIAKELKDENFPEYDPKDEGSWMRVFNYLSNTETNRRYGRYYLNKQLTKYGGDVEAALIAYNAGPGVADKWLKAYRDDSMLPAETRSYKKNIMENAGLPAVSQQNVPGGSPDVKFVWARKGENTVLHEDDPILTGVNPALVGKVKQAFAAAGETEIKLNSGRRDHKHNAEVGGATKSQHLPQEGLGGKGNAFDINVAGWTNERKARLIQSLSAAGITGIGVGSNIIHADLGNRRTWQYENGKAVQGTPGWAAGVIADHMANKTAPLSAKGPMKGPAQNLSYEKRMALISDLDASMAAQERERQRVDVQTKVQVEQLMRDNLDTLTNSGQPRQGFDPQMVLNALGEEKYLEYMTKEQYAREKFKALSPMRDMDDNEITAHLEQYTVPGTSTTASYQDRELQRSVEAEALRLRSLRSRDPGAAAMEFQDIQDAYTAFVGNPNEPIDPQAAQAFIRANLEKQKTFNVEPDALDPLPRRDALVIGRDLASKVRNIGGTGDSKVSAQDQLADLALFYFHYKEVFGEYTDEVLVQALEEFKGIEEHTAKRTLSIMKDQIGRGKPPEKVFNIAKTEEDITQSSGWFGSEIVDWVADAIRPGRDTSAAGDSAASQTRPNNRATINQAAQRLNSGQTAEDLRLAGFDEDTITAAAAVNGQFEVAP